MRCSTALIALAIVVVPASSFASSYDFIQQRALDPIKLQTGLPEAASRLESKQALQVEFSHNNVFMGGFANDELLVLDGESSQLNLRYRHKLNACWQLNVNASLLAHSGGQFDQLVDDFHQTFGLPDAMRNLTPFDALDYSYTNGNQQQRLADEFQGVGDAQLQLQRYLGCGVAAPIVRGGIKLPIGSTETFSGSGGFDAFVDVQSRWKQINRFPRFWWAASAGLLAASSNDLLAEQRPLAAYGTFGTNVMVGPTSEFILQLDWHSPLFDSELTELGNIGAQATLGFRKRFANRGDLELSFSEDIAIDTAPDIVVRVAWTARFGAK